MSTFVWMKVLESTPERYDRGIRLLTHGRIDEVYRRIADIAAGPGRRVLDVGCGTGAVALACAARGAEVIGVDIDAGMLEVARAKPVPDGGRVTWVEASVAEIEDHVGPAAVDAVVSCLAFSELSDEEQDYTLSVALSRLVPGGALVLADEVEPEGAFARTWHRLRRAPRAALTYALTQATTRPLVGMGERVREAGFVDVREQRMLSDAFLLLTAARSEAT